MIRANDLETLANTVWSCCCRECAIVHICVLCELLHTCLCCRNDTAEFTHAGCIAACVGRAFSYVYLFVCLSVCLFVCLFVRALNAKWLELSTPNLVQIYSIAVARQALTVSSEGQG